MGAGPRSDTNTQRGFLPEDMPCGFATYKLLVWKGCGWFGSEKHRQL